MHKLTSTVVLAAAFVCVSALNAQPAPSAKKAASTGGTSPHETISAYIGGTRRSGGQLITISYGRPYSKDPKSGEVRKIWGTLVPWNKAYRLGADEATLLVTPVPLVIAETTIPAGAYTLYMLPSETGTTKLAFSTNIGKWGIPVDEAHDLERVDLKKGSVDNQVDQLTLALAQDPANTATGGLLTITWETTQFTLPFTVKKP